MGLERIRGCPTHPPPSLAIRAIPGVHPWPSFRKGTKRRAVKEFAGLEKEFRALEGNESLWKERKGTRKKGRWIERAL